MSLWVSVAGLATFCASLLLTMLIKRMAGPLGLIDVPNERSSHAVPTPRGGGLAIVVSSIAAMALLAVAGLIPVRLFLAIAPGGVAVAVIGFIDDRRPLSARIRLFVHFVAAAWAVLCIRPAELFQAERGSPALECLVYGLSTIGIVWFLNMYNFMDGIDGIAGSQAVFMCLGTAVLGVYSLGVAYASATAVVIGAATLAFLFWNWPPAKIFMGDVGSGYLGFVFAVMGLASGIHDPTSPWTLLILAGVFAIDATSTLLRRFVRGERVTAPHRTHAFQLLAQRIGHRRVTLAIALVNMVWLLPCALASALWPEYVGWILPVAASPLVVGALAIGAGQPEPSPGAVAPPAVVIRFPRRAVFARRTAPLAHAYHGRPPNDYYSRHSVPGKRSNRMMGGLSGATTASRVLENDVGHEPGSQHPISVTNLSTNAQRHPSREWRREPPPRVDYVAENSGSELLRHGKDTSSDGYPIEQSATS